MRPSALIPLITRSFAAYGFLRAEQHSLARVKLQSLAKDAQLLS